MLSAAFTCCAKVPRAQQSDSRFSKLHWVMECWYLGVICSPPGVLSCPALRAEAGNLDDFYINLFSQCTSYMAMHCKSHMPVSQSQPQWPKCIVVQRIRACGDTQAACMLCWRGHVWDMAASVCVKERVGRTTWFCCFFVSDVLSCVGMQAMISRLHVCGQQLS